MQADTPQGESAFPTVPTADELAAFIAAQGAQPTAPDTSGGSRDAPVVAPLALVSGQPFTQLPLDLYIPPDALEVFLDTFEGPLDLLLYLIKRQNLDILDVPIAEITAQYMKYIALMETLKLELAGEYLLMAAMLAEIKSRMLLPRADEELDEENDPRAELIRRLQEYEQVKQAAESLEEQPRMERELHQLKLIKPDLQRDVPDPDVSLQELLLALRDVTHRASLKGHHNISRETLSVRARMSKVLDRLSIGEFCEFSTLFDPEEGRLGIVVTFLAVLELCKESVIEIVQSEPFAPIYLKPRGEVSVDGGADGNAEVNVDASAEPGQDAEDPELMIEELPVLPRVANQAPSE